MEPEIISKTKSQQLRDILKKDLLSGKLSVGSQFYSQSELVERYNLSLHTAREALAVLVQDGLLTRSQGKGTFVARTREKIQESHLAALFMPTNGHLYGEFSRHIIGMVQEAGFHALTCDLYASAAKEKLPERMERLIAGDMGVFIVDGISLFPFGKLRRYDEKLIVFIYRFETPLSFPNAFKVLHDFEAGGYMVMKHLLGMGHKKVLFSSHPIQPEPYFLSHSLLKGMCRAFEEKGLDSKKSLVLKMDAGNNSEKDLNNLVRVLSGPHRPTAAFAFGDNRAKTVFSAARKLNLSIPDDLAIVGYYNTPWCEMLPVPLTSVSIETDSMVAEVGNILQRIQQGEKITEKCIMVKPRLIVRESTGCRTTKEVQLTYAGKQ